jgi:hypothetical protein
MRRLRWGDEPPAVPARPYRDTALVYLGFALVIVVVATATGGGFVRAVIVAALFWIAATGYGWLRWRRRIAEERRRP